VFLFQPYPRTELGEHAARLGLLEGDINAIDTSAWNRSILKFPPEEKRQIENLQKLFAVTVEFPWLLPITRQLLKLPPVFSPLLWLVHKLWKGFTIQKRIHPVKLDVARVPGDGAEVREAGVGEQRRALVCTPAAGCTATPRGQLCS
jgi:anaerobic magnesium-protoporphyrin IX monomethyl ester cyclase